MDELEFDFDLDEVLTKESLLSAINSNIEKFDNENKLHLTESKEVYQDKSNFEQHPKPDQLKFLYPQNPHIVFTGEGIPKDSPAGQIIMKNVEKTRVNNIKINNLREIKKQLQENPDLLHRLNMMQEQSKVSKILSFLLGILEGNGSKAASLKAKLFENPEAEHKRECKRLGLDPDFN